MKLNRIVAAMVLLLSPEVFAANFDVKEVKVKDLTYFFTNGFLFGPTAYSTYGIRISRLIPVTRDPSGVLVRGKTCELTSETGMSQSGAQYDLGHRYGLENHAYFTDGSFLQLSFANIYHSPGLIYIHCDGSLSRVSNITLGQIEKDLGNAIEFYRNK